MMAVVTLLNAVQANGPGTALDCRNAKKAAFVITGTFDAAVNFEFSVDGTNYYPFTGEVNGSLCSSVTYSAGHVLFDVEAVAYIRPKVSGYKSGSITVIGYMDDTKVANVQLTGRLLRKTQVGIDQDVTFADSAAANTQVVVTITQPASPVDEYELIVYNPSTVTYLTCKVFTVEVALGGGDRDSYLTSFSVPKSQAVTGTTINTYIRQLHGIFNGGNLKLVFSNDTALEAAEGFTAKARLRELV